MIDESYRHVLSDEPAEYPDERREQRFDRRGDCRDAVRLDAREHAIQVNVVFVEPANVLQRGMVRFRTRERPREQRVASSIAHGIAQVVGHAQTHLLQRGDGHLASTFAHLCGFTGQEAASDLQ
jgi:hypothetical protein